MSRWLKSVNNLLESLDGQAETVAAEASAVVASATSNEKSGALLGQILQQGRQAIISNATSSSNNNRNRTLSSSTDGSSYYEEEEVEDDDDDDNDDEEDVYEEEEYDDEISGEEYEEELFSADDDEEDDKNVDLDSDTAHNKGKLGGLEAALQASTDSEDAVSIGVQERGAAGGGRGSKSNMNDLDNDTVSEISFTEHTDEEIVVAVGTGEEGDEQKQQWPLQQNTASNKIAGVVEESLYTTNSSSHDAPPKTPNRYLSVPEEVEELAQTAKAANKSTLLQELPAPPPPPPLLTYEEQQQQQPQDGSQHRRPSNSNTTTTNRSSSASPKVLKDASPRPPRRSIEDWRHAVPDATGLLDDDIYDTTEEENESEKDKDNKKANDDKDNDNTLSSSVDNNSKSRTTGSTNNNNTVTAPSTNSDAPRLPTRQSSIPIPKQKQEQDPPQPQQRQVVQVPPTSANTNSKSKASTTTRDRDSAKLLAKIQSLQNQLHKTNTELKTSQMQNSKLQKQVSSLETQLESANAEITAQSEELRRAGERMEKDRLRAQEEREDLLDEQDEELEQLKESHDKEMQETKKQYEQQIAELTNRLAYEEQRRKQEGGDWTKELEDAIQRERDALKKLNEVQIEKSNLQSTVSKLESNQTALQNKLESALQSQKTAAERERQAEDRLDAALSLHARQMSQRQSREAELEKTIFDLGTALMRARQQQQQQQQNPGETNSAGVPFHTSTSATTSQHAAQDSSETLSYKEKYDGLVDELETLKVQYHMETQRREALQQELNDIAKERTEEASSIQARQLLQDRKISDLESTIARLQTSLRAQKVATTPGSNTDCHNNNDNNQRAATSHLETELAASKREISKLSEQLMRYQGMADTTKSEILALKGRLQAATSRAEQAEKSLMEAQLQQQSMSASTSRMYDMEIGGAGGGILPTHLRRRVKGGNNVARNRNQHRTIRSALHMSPGRMNNHPILEQVAMTLDALDNWMVETGSFLRHEPLARLAFMMYLLTLHLWSFALVVFHTSEVPHGDFGSMDNNPLHWRSLAQQQQQQQQQQQSP